MESCLSHAEGGYKKYQVHKYFCACYKNPVKEAPPPSQSIIAAYHKSKGSVSTQTLQEAWNIWLWLMNTSEQNRPVVFRMIDFLNNAKPKKTTNPTTTKNYNQKTPNKTYKKPPPPNKLKNPNNKQTKFPLAPPRWKQIARKMHMQEGKVSCELRTIHMPVKIHYVTGPHYSSTT